MAIQPTLSGLLLPSTISLPDTQDLRDWPHIPAEVVCRHAKQLGAAGEALFDSQMLCFGEIGLPVPEFLSFDRVLLRSPQLLRVQIKTVTMPSDHGYAVTPRKGYRGSPQGMRAYEADEYDLLAIVILSEGVIRYSAATAGRPQWRRGRSPGPRHARPGARDRYPAGRGAAGRARDERGGVEEVGQADQEQRSSCTAQGGGECHCAGPRVIDPVSWPAAKWKSPLGFQRR